MTYRPLRRPPSESDLRGLTEFFASQARAMLTEYEHVNRLLGITSDWTHPGTHCEHLLRAFLRRHLPRRMSIDKGFFHGRVNRPGVDAHTPEIDLLIHDEDRFRPLFRLDDFVIVQPEAVLAIIQVKRTLRMGGKGSLRKGIAQAVDAKQALLDLTVSSKAEGLPSHPEWRDMRPVCSAVVGFEDATGGAADVYRTALLAEYDRNRTRVYPACEFDTGTYVLPDFVGSVRGRCFASAGRMQGERRYWSFHSGADNPSALQLLLGSIMDALLPEHDHFPIGTIDWDALQVIQVPVQPRATT